MLYPKYHALSEGHLVYCEGCGLKTDSAYLVDGKYLCEACRRKLS